MVSAGEPKMSKGRFRHPVRIKLSNLEVPHTDRTFVVQIIAYGSYGFRGVIPIAYFGYIDDGIFHVTSFSFSVQHLPQSTREAYNADPHDTAMIGLETAGEIIRRR